MNEPVETTPAPVVETPAAPKTFAERIQERAAQFRTAAPPDDPVVAPPDVNAEATPDPVASDVSGDELPPVEGAVKDANGKWRGPDGKFVAAKTDDVVPDEPTETPTEPVLFTLAGDKERGEDDLELDLTGLPSEAVERLNRIKNDGLRRVEYNKQKVALDRAQAELKTVETEIAVNPVGFVLDRLPPVVRKDIAEALFLEHYDELIERFAGYSQSDGDRKLALSKVRDGLREGSKRVEAISSHEQRAAQVMDAARALIPDTASDEDAQEFITDAALHFEALTRQGTDIRPDAVPDLLASRLRRYGFHGKSPSQSSASAKPPVPKLAVASPKGPDAQTLAEKAKAQQQRLKVSQQSRQNGAAVAPAGAGATPTTRIQPPKGQTIEERAAWVRKNGFAAAVS